MAAPTPSPRLVAPFEDGVAPLTDAERVLSERVARRLCLELRGVVASLPEAERSASAMARALGIDRNNCQRVVATTARADPDATALVQLPGVAGIRQFLKAVAARGGVPVEVLASAEAAVDQYDRLIDHLAGSQRKLRERIKADALLGDGVAHGPGDNLRLRRSMFQLAAQATGRWSQTWLSASIIREVPGDASRTEAIKLRGHIGHLARAGALPLEIGEEAQSKSGTPGERAFVPLDPSGDPARAFLLTPFCSKPLPRVTSRGMGSRMIHVVEGSAGVGGGSGGTGDPVDIVTADRRATPDANPALGDPPIGEVWTLITFPARRLVFDVYLHRSLAARCAASLEMHLWGPHSGGQGLWRWSTRFPGGPKLEVLPAGEHRGVADAYARHGELVRYAFLHAGWDPAEFVCYRGDVLYPLWRTGYCMLFDFGRREG